MGRFVAALLLACLVLPLASGRNITTILAGYKEYKLYNKYLSETRVCDEINDRQSTSMTILVLGDSAMSTLVSDAKESLPAIKNALRLLAVLDYYDRKKVKKYGGESADTLFQATGDAVSATGNVKVTDVEDGEYGFSSATAGADVSTVTKEVKTQPFKFAILEISAPIEFDGLFNTPSTANLTLLLERAGCKTFAALVASSPGVLKDLEGAMDTGLTLFAPNDAAFMAKGVPDVKTMSAANVTKLLRYHALPAYYPKASLKTVKKAELATMLASKKKEAISVEAKGDDVGLEAGGSKSRVADTVVDKAPFCLLLVDNLLVPAELAVAQAPSPAPAPAPAEAPSKSERRPADAPSDEAADDAADHHKAKNSTSSSDAASSRPVGVSFAAAAAVCSVVLAAVL